MELLNLITTTQETSNDSTLIYTQGIEQTTIYGKVKGSKENNEKTLLWQGIPYAKAPIGNLRWKAPEDLKYGIMYLMPQLLEMWVYNYPGSDIIGSEDCLNLDIYRQTLMKLTFLYYYLFMEVIIKLVLVLKLMQENLLLMLIV